MGRVLAVANQKGGVGKTTTAVNFAASLVVADQSVLLVDLDPQGNASTGLGLVPGSVPRGTYRGLIGEVPMADLIYETEMPGLSLIGANQDLAAAELELVDDEDRALRLRQALAPLRDRFDYIVVDCPPSLGVLTINALTAAELVLVPLQCEYYALEGLSKLVGTIERVRASLNPALSLHGVVLTMYDGRNNLAKEVAAEVRRHFRVYRTVIPRNIRLAEAPSYGKPVYLYDSASLGSFGYVNLAREFLEIIEGEAA